MEHIDKEQEDIGFCGSVYTAKSQSVNGGVGVCWIPPKDLIQSEIDKNLALIKEANAKTALCESMKRYFDNVIKDDTMSKSEQISMRAAGILSGDIV